jgi:hypothetical protein
MAQPQYDPYNTGDRIEDASEFLRDAAAETDTAASTALIGIGWVLVAIAEELRAGRKERNARY